MRIRGGITLKTSGVVARSLEVFIYYKSVQMDGRIKLHRKMLDWERKDDPNTFCLFLHCLLLANWEDKKWRGVSIPRGSFVTSLNNLSRSLGLSIQQVRSSINKLKSTHNITHKATNKYSLITVCKWEEYQSMEDLPTNKATSNSTNEQQTNNKQITTTKNIKNIKKERNIYMFDDFWKEYPRKKGKPKAEQKYMEVIRNGATHEEIMEGLKNYCLEIKHKNIQEDYIKRPQGRLSDKRRLDEYDTKPQNPLGNITFL